MLNSHSRVILPKRPITTAHGINRDISEEHKRIWRGLDLEKTIREIDAETRFQQRLLRWAIVALISTTVVSTTLLALQLTGHL